MTAQVRCSVIRRYTILHMRDKPPSLRKKIHRKVNSLSLRHSLATLGTLHFMVKSEEPCFRLAQNFFENYDKF